MSRSDHSPEKVMDDEMRVEVALYDVLNKTLGASLPTVAARQRAAIMPLVRRAQADKVRQAAELVMDPRDGLPFNADHDLAIVSAWLDETADRIEQNSEGNET